MENYKNELETILRLYTGQIILIGEQGSGKTLLRDSLPAKERLRVGTFQGLGNPQAYAKLPKALLVELRGEGLRIVDQAKSSKIHRFYTLFRGNNFEKFLE